MLLLGLKILLALATLVSAIIAATYWLKSSLIKMESGYTGEGASITDAPELHIMGTQTDIFKMLAAIGELSRLNKHAAIWTGVSAVLGACTAIIGLFP